MHTIDVLADMHMRMWMRIYMHMSRQFVCVRVRVYRGIPYECYGFTGTGGTGLPPAVYKSTTTVRM